MVVPTSWEAGCGPPGRSAADAEIARRRSRIAFLALSTRPPSHAQPAMGFFAYSTTRVTSGLLSSQGAKVAVVDWDVHHGNGTQAMFYQDPNVLYVSIHQFPFYPYEGRAEEVGEGPGVGSTVNIPVPAGTAGDAYQMAWNEIVSPVLTQFDADWILVSAGYDAHSEDPLAELRLEAVNLGGWHLVSMSSGQQAGHALSEGGYTCQR